MWGASQAINREETSEIERDREREGEREGRERGGEADIERFTENIQMEDLGNVLESQLLIVMYKRNSQFCNQIEKYYLKAV